MKLKLFFALQVHNFQHRLCFQLSSILQQCGCSGQPDLTIGIACTENNGTPTTEEIAERFSTAGLKVSLDLYRSPSEIETFAKRGLVRNRQINLAKQAWNGVGADWIFFADSDNVYPRDFFAKLGRYLKRGGRKETRCIYSRSKAHTEVEATNEAVELCLDDIIIPDAHTRALFLPTIRKANKRTAAGCMQVCSMEAIQENTGGIYVDPKRCKDRHLFNQRQGARSDRQFRAMMGGSCPIDLPRQIHLNHRRDKEEGRHLEIQR